MPGLIIKPLNKLMANIGIKPIETTFTKIISQLTTLDMWVVFIVFTAGFLAALIIFLISQNATQIKQHEQYTAGEIVPELRTMPSIYHYSKNYYRPFSRIFKNIPDLENIYRNAADFLVKIFDIVEEFFYKRTVSGYVWLISILFIIIILIRWV